MILENLEFDGSTVLCRVCGDKASGFHYGVHACEGCKGFFRRSIQQKIQYRPCLKNQQCNIMRVNRNRCQYCRLKKCIAVGMSRDAVRFGRVPKKEKAKIMEQMKRVNAQSQINALHSSLENDQEFLDKIIKAHFHNCDYTNEKVREMIDRAWLHPQFISCPAHMACPLNPKPDSPATTEGSNDKWDDFTEYFTPAIRNVVNFAKNIPGFQTFSQEDQVNLLKAGTFEVLLVHLAPFFDAKHSTMMFANGRLFKRASFNMSSNAGFLLDSMFDFSERMNTLSLTDEEIALFSAAVIVAADRPGLRNIEMVERVQRKIHQGLQMLVKLNHRDDPSLFPKLLMKIPDLRTLNTLHSEKLLGMTVAPNGQPVADVKQEAEIEVSPTADTHDIADEVVRKKTCPFASGKSASSESRYPPMLGHPFPLQLPFAPQLPFPRSHDYRSDLLHNAFSMYNATYPRQQIPIYPQVVKQELPFKVPKSPKQWMADMTQPPHASDFGTHVKDLLLAQNQDGPQENKEDSIPSDEYSPRSPILDVLHDDEEDDNIDVDIHDDQELVFGSDQCLTEITEINSKIMDQPGSPLESTEHQLLIIESPELEKSTRRKRPMDLSKHEVQTKISKVQSDEYDVRSSRSDSISSHTSIDSTDSAYRTISSPGTPRSLGNTEARSPLQTHSKSLLKDCLKSQLPDDCKLQQNDERLNVGYEPATDNSNNEKVPVSLPVLKQALSIPPLVAQESWFYNPKCKKSSADLLGSDYSSSQTSSRSGSPDELKKSSGKQFKLKKALLERFSPSCQEDTVIDAEVLSDQSRNSSPLSLKSRLLNRVEKDTDSFEESTVKNKEEVLDLQVHKNPVSSPSKSCTVVNDIYSVKKPQVGGSSDLMSRSHISSSSSSCSSYVPFHSKSHTATLASNHTASSPSSQARSHIPCPLPPAYLGMALPQPPPVHPALLYQYSAMQQQFKTLQQLEAATHRAMLNSQVEQRSQPMADHALNLAVKKEPV